MSSIFIKLIKFICVGISGLIVDFTITYVLKEYLKINKYISNSLGFTVAASSNYILNRLWTFSSENPRVLLEYSSFIVISIIGLGINNLFLYLFHKKLKFYPSKLLAIIVTTGWNFFANYFITFNL